MRQRKFLEYFFMSSIAILPIYSRYGMIMLTRESRLWPRLSGTAPSRVAYPGYFNGKYQRIAFRLLIRGGSCGLA
jgi:hypothetical protein